MDFSGKKFDIGNSVIIKARDEDGGGAGVVGGEPARDESGCVVWREWNGEPSVGTGGCDGCGGDGGVERGEGAEIVRRVRTGREVEGGGVNDPNEEKGGGEGGDKELGRKPPGGGGGGGEFGFGHGVGMEMEGSE